MKMKLVSFTILCTLLLLPTIASAEAVDGGIRLGHGRLLPTTAALVGLIGVVIGGLALARSAGRSGTGSGRSGSIAAMALGLISTVIGGLHAAFSAGGLGTGNGLAGAIAAIVLGLISMVIGGLALTRSRRTG